MCNCTHSSATLDIQYFLYITLVFKQLYFEQMSLLTRVFMKMLFYLNYKNKKFIYKNDTLHTITQSIISKHTSFQIFTYTNLILLLR